MDRDENRLTFCSLDTVKREAGAIPAEIYDSPGAEIRHEDRSCAAERGHEGGQAEEE